MSTSECLTSALTRRAGLHGVQFASKIFQLYASFLRIRDLEICVDHEYVVVKFHRISKVTLITACITVWSVKIDSLMLLVMQFYDV